MNNDKQRKLSRRQFAGRLAAALGAPTLLGALPAAGADPAQKKKKPEAKKPPAPPPVPAEEEKLLKALREFPVPEGAEPAFAFRADWGARSR